MTRNSRNSRALEWFRALADELTTYRILQPEHLSQLRHSVDVEYRENIVQMLARALGMSETDLRTVLGVDLSQTQPQTTLTMVEIPRASDAQQVVIIPSPLYDFIYAYVAQGSFPVVIAENLSRRIVTCLESFGVTVPLEALRVQTVNQAMVLVHISLERFSPDERMQMLNVLMNLGGLMRLSSAIDAPDHLVGDNSIEELIDLVKKDDRTLFNELAPIVGIPMEKLDHVWDGIKRRIK